MSNETLLFICGIVLAISAVTVSFIGLKVKDFPGKAMPLIVLWFGILVVATTTFAVLHAKDEEGDKAKEARYEKAGEEFEKEGGHVPPLEASHEEEPEETEEAPAEGEGHSEEGPEEAGAAEKPESAEEGAEEPKAEEGEAGGAKAGEGGATAAAGGNPEAGEMIFAENCAVCHGETGHGGAGGPDLRTMPKAQSEEGAIEQVTDGGGGMPPFGSVLSEEEIQNVASYVVQDVVGKG